MADKITLTTFGSLQNDTSATTDLNTNSAAITTAMNNTLSRDGTSPNQMNANLDMNANHILNLPTPTSNFDPVRLIDATTLGSGGTITINPLPVGGTAGQALVKNSNTNFDATWSAALGTVINGGTGNSTLLAHSLLLGEGTSPVGQLATNVPGTVLTCNPGSDPVFSTTPTLGNVGVNTGTLTLATSAAGNIIVSPGTTNSTYSFILPANIGTGSATGQFLANANGGAMTWDNLGNHLVAGGGITITGTTTCTISSPATTGGQLPATATNDNATTGNLGEYVESIVPLGSAVALSNGIDKDVTTINLTAGDWDVDGVVQFTGGATTAVNIITGGISTTLNTRDLTAGRTTGWDAAARTVFNDAGATTPVSCVVPPLRFSISGTTTMHLVASVGFTVSTCSGFGILRARRVR